MDHLDYADAIHSKLKTRLRCYCQDDLKRDSFKQPNFHSFANGEHGWTVTLTGELEQMSSDTEHNYSATSFVQRWLYFEVLHELFHDLPDFNVRQFVQYTASDCLLTTTTLPALLTAWSASLLNSKTKWTHLARAQDVLNTARSYILKLDPRVEAGDQTPSNTWSKVKDDAILSIIILGETLTTALRKIQRAQQFDHKDWNILRDQSCGWGYRKTLFNVFETIGWSRGAIQDLKLRCMNSTNALLHAMIFQTPPKISVLDDQYRVRHLCEAPHSNCALIGVPDYNVIDIINQGMTPMFRYFPQEQRLVVQPHSGGADRPYVAISHVWEDGFGNPSTNKLNECVLGLFARLFPEDQPRIGHRQSNLAAYATQLFWIDTLGVPVSQNFKKERQKVTNRIHMIYKHAQATFVLNMGKVSLVNGQEYSTAAMSIGLSNWARRLWTLQDAVLSRELQFVFKDNVMSVLDLERHLDEEDKILHNCVPQVARQYRQWILWSTGALNENGEVDIKNASILAQVWRAVQWRTTEHLRHETLALATLFGLETTALEAISETSASYESGAASIQNDLNQRMREFIVILKRNQASIPAAFLFLPGPHLPFPGFRWAPRTWLTNLSHEYIEQHSQDEKSCSLTLEGLRGQLPGFMLHELDTNADRLEELPSFCFTSDLVLQNWFLVEKADQLSEPWFRGRQTNLALVCQSNSTYKQSQIALLVSIQELRRTQYRAIILRQVKITKVIDPATLVMLASRFRDSKHGPLCCGQYLPHAEWILDGSGSNEEDIPLPSNHVRKLSHSVQPRIPGAGAIIALAKFGVLLKAVRQRYGSPTLIATKDQNPIPFISLEGSSDDAIYTSPTEENQGDGDDANNNDSARMPSTRRSNLSVSTRTGVAIDTQLSPITYRSSLHSSDRSPIFSNTDTSISEYPDTDSVFSGSTRIGTTSSWPISRRRSQGDDNQAAKNTNIQTGLRDTPQDQRLLEVSDDTSKHNSGKGTTDISKEDHPWISELEDLGLSNEEIQALLQEQSRDSPWIRFNPRNKVEAIVQPGKHIANCVHKWQPESNPHLATEDGETHTNRHVSEHPDTIRNIQELCGLAGIVPEADDQYPAAKTVSFRNDNAIASVSYTSYMNNSSRLDDHNIWTTIIAALKSFCHAAGLAQATGLCCQSFTIVYRGADMLETRAVPFEHAVTLLDVLSSWSDHTELHRYDRIRIYEACWRVLRILDQSQLPITTQIPGSQEIQHQCALAVQFLCLGFVSYLQAHLGSLKLFFLDTSIQAIRLSGALSNEKEYSSSLSFVAQLENLTCLGAGTRAPLFSFHVYSSSDILNSTSETPQTKAYDISGFVEDVIDTWGPASFLLTKDVKPGLVAIGILGGYIYSTDGPQVCHWAAELRSNSLSRDPIDIERRIVIGRPATVNENCPWRTQETRCMNETPGSFQSLGGYQQWHTFEPQAGISGGMIVNGHFNVTGKTHDGLTWKKHQLPIYRKSNGANLSHCLNSMWGLQVSFCTNVARRIPMHQVLAELLPKIYLPDNVDKAVLWKKLDEHYNIFKVLRDNGLPELLKRMDKQCSELLKELILTVLEILEPTGLDVNGSHITLAWPTADDNQRCRTISCRGDSSWIRLLTDTAKSATFAYITMICLETTDHICRGPKATAAWQDRLNHLETEVGPKSILRHDTNYFFQQLNGPFVMKAQRSMRHDTIRLFVPFVRMPVKLQVRVLERFLKAASLELWEKKNVLDGEQNVAHVVVGQKAY